MSYMLMIGEGFQQSLHPCFFSHFLILLLLILFVSKSSFQRKLFGVVFLFSLYLGMISARVFLDIFLQQYSIFLQKVYLLIGVVFFVFGLGFFYDWVQCFRLKERQQFLLTFPVKNFFSKKKIFSFLTFFCISSASFLLGAFAADIIPLSRLAIYASNQLLVPEQSVSAMLFLASYTFGELLPVIVLGLIIIFIVDSKFFERTFRHSWMKIILSATYFSVGIALIYLF